MRSKAQLATQTSASTEPSGQRSGDEAQPLPAVLLKVSQVQDAQDHAVEQDMILSLQGTVRAAQQALWEMSSQHSSSRLPLVSAQCPRLAAPGLPQHSSAEGSRPWVSPLVCGAGGSGCCSVITLSQCCSSQYQAEIMFWTHSSHWKKKGKEKPCWLTDKSYFLSASCLMRRCCPAICPDSAGTERRCDRCTKEPSVLRASFPAISPV